MKNWEGGRGRKTWTFKDLKNFILENQLLDLGFERKPWTWSNHWENRGEIRIQLHRTMCTDNWKAFFDQTKCQHIEVEASDHCVLLIESIPLANRKVQVFFLQMIVKESRGQHYDPNNLE